MGRTTVAPNLTRTRSTAIIIGQDWYAAAPKPFAASCQGGPCA